MRTTLTLLLAFVASTALAHDFWIEPSTFRPQVRTTLLMTLRVGQEFAGDPVARDSPMIDRLIIHDGAGDHVIAGIERRDPAGLLSVEHPGMAVIGSRSRPKCMAMQ